MTLFGQWRSSASWRVRTVLALKGIKYSYQPVIEPIEETNVPVLVFTRVDASTGKTSETRLEHSIAIIEFLEEIYANVPLLPKLNRKFFFLFCFVCVC